MEKSHKGISFFEKYLSIWVLLCMGTGILIGKFAPIVPEILGKMEYAKISLPIARNGSIFKANQKEKIQKNNDDLKLQMNNVLKEVRTLI